MAGRIQNFEGLECAVAKEDVFKFVERKCGRGKRAVQQRSVAAEVKRAKTISNHEQQRAAGFQNAK